MAGQQVSQVFGPNTQTRIAGTAQLSMEPGETAPSLPWYQPVVPFYPPSITSGETSSNSTTADGHKIWETTPSRCDLLFYQGDDVIIPLFFNDPLMTGDDMSDQTWVAQIRLIHRYRSRLVAEFVTTASYTAGAETVEATKVELFLPRSDNLYYGQFRWDLYSVSDSDLSRFPMPVDMPEDEIWPPPDILRTWLYGVCTISPRVTDTDYLTGSSGDYPVPYPGPPPYVTVMTTGGYCVGPNGRVP